jgi:hypothetical protein
VLVSLAALSAQLYALPLRELASRLISAGLVTARGWRH